MVLSKRYAKAKSDKYNGNINKRNVDKSDGSSKAYPFSVGPVVLCFFVFVVLGSSIVEILLKLSSNN